MLHVERADLVGQIVAGLHCSTSDKALVKFSTSDHVTAEAQVRGTNCNVIDAHVTTSGEVGKVLAAALDASGRAHRAPGGPHQALRWSEVSASTFAADSLGNGKGPLAPDEVRFA